MRKIKFRMWDTLEESFMNHSHVIESRVLALENNGEGRFIFQQWTGLFDRHGVEIYKGDIVKHCNPHWSHNDNQKFVVEWDETISQNGMQLLNCGWNFKETHKGFSTHFVPSEDFEVIGNIYQNANLLEESK